MDEQVANVGSIDFASWLIRLVTWDGVLPFLILIVPSCIEQVFPNRGAIEIAAVVVPISFFFWRIATGCRHIDANNCSPALRRRQVCALILAVFILVFFDALMILSHIMPKGAFAVNREDLIIIAALASIYVVPISLATYPGRSKPLPTVLRPE